MKIPVYDSVHYQRGGSSIASTGAGTAGHTYRNIVGVSLCAFFVQQAQNVVVALRHLQSRYRSRVGLFFFFFFYWCSCPFFIFVSVDGVPAYHFLSFFALYGLVRPGPGCEAMRCPFGCLSTLDVFRLWHKTLPRLKCHVHFGSLFVCCVA